MEVDMVLWLRHVAVEEGERAQVLDPIPSVGVDGVKALVKFHLHQHLVLRRCIYKLTVFFQSFHWRFGDQHMHPSPNAGQCYLQMCVVRCEDNSTIASFERCGCGPERLWVYDVICRKCLHNTRVNTIIDVAQHALHVCSDLRKFFAIGAAHAKTAQLPAHLQVKAYQGNYSCSLVRVCSTTSNEACCVLASAKHQTTWTLSSSCCDLLL